LEFQPERRWNYGVSFDVLGRVVEVVSGKQLDAYFKEHIFELLGVKDTGFAVPKDKLGRFAALYERTDENELTLLEAQ